MLRCLGATSAGVALLAALSCGSSSETITVSPLSRCAVQAQADTAAFAPDGGTGVIRISTNRECTWSARGDAAWVTLTPPVSGQGDGSVQFTIGANADPGSRAAAITIENQRLQVSQEGRRCDFSLSSVDETFDTAGGERTIQVTTGSAQCRWTAVPDAPWITVVSGAEGGGSGAVRVRVAASDGPPRTGIITIAGHAVQVEQGPGCSYTVGTAAFSLGAAGGTGDIPVTAPAGCNWTAESQAPWIAIASGAAGSGPGAVGFRVAPTEGPARTGTLTVAGRVVTVTQSPGCTYTIEPLTYAAPQSGGAGVVTVRTGPGCAWAATSASEWISVTAGQSGNGPGEVRFSVTANAAPGRAGALRIADQTVTVTQGSGCAFSVSPQSASVGASAATGAFQVTAPAGCAWSAASASDWITITAGSSGTGAGAVTFSAAANAALARTGTLQIANQTVTVSQASGCTFTVSPPGVAVGAAAATGAFQVAAAAGCTWSAASASEWITIAAGASGSGSGQVQFAAAANTGPARQGALSIAGHSVAVSQANGCTYDVAPTTRDVGPGGDSSAASVTTGAGCPWTAASSVSWITVSSPSGAGPAQASFTVASNQGPPRTGTLSVASQVLTINQSSSCTWIMAPPSHSFDSGGGNGNILVIVTGACTWTAASNVDWITMTAGESGTGSGLVQFVAAPNSGPSRTGSLTIAGQRYEVVEAGR